VPYGHRSSLTSYPTVKSNGADFNFEVRSGALYLRRRIAKSSRFAPAYLLNRRRIIFPFESDRSLRSALRSGSAAARSCQTRRTEWNLEEESRRLETAIADLV